MLLELDEDYAVLGNGEPVIAVENCQSYIVTTVLDRIKEAGQISYWVDGIRQNALLNVDYQKLAQNRGIAVSGNNV